jgi:hypothetical protein
VSDPNYQRGYRAGKRKGKLDAETQQLHSLRAAAENDFWQRAFLETLNSTIISSRWQTSGKNWSNAEQYAQGCANMADVFLAKAKARFRI